VGSWNEQSQVVVETVTKSSTTKLYGALHPMNEVDVSKITSKGAGLQKALINKDATFTIDASRAG
jgi:filamin